MARPPKDPMPTTVRVKKPKIDYPKLLVDQILSTDLPILIVTGKHL